MKRKAKAEMVTVSVIAAALALGASALPALAAFPVCNPATGVACCMQDIYKAGGGSGSLNCSSNDVRIAKVTNITNVSGISGTTGNLSCISGSPIEFTADFEVDLGATGGARYDIGLYLAQGQTQALTGTCNASIITGPNGNALHFDQLDAAPDICGDISGTVGSTYNPQFVHLDIKTTCTPGANNKLLLPNCTSWRQPGSNDVCQGITDAFPGSPSKCNCDNNFTIDVTVEHPILEVSKSVTPTQVDWPGGNVTYTVTVHNPATATSVTLIKLTEDETNNDSIDRTFDATSTPLTISDICVSTTLAPCGPDPAHCADASTTTCTFTGSVSGNQGDNITDKACVTGQNGGIELPVCATATVSIKDVVPTAAVTKTAEKAVCAVIRYDVKVENTDPAESLSLTALCDDKFGDISSGGNSSPTCATGAEHANLRSGTTTPCVLPQTIGVKDSSVPGSGQYNCTFDALVCDFAHQNTVSATLTDGRTPITKTGSVTVTGVTLQ